MSAAAAAPPAAPGLLAANPGKRRMEQWVLLYSPLWIAVVAWVMLGRRFTGWGEAGHLILGVGLALPLWTLPLLAPPPSEQGLPLAARPSFRFNLWITLTSFVQCDLGSRFFFEILGMEYHFPVRLAWHGTPIFLYFMTVAYFATYYVAMQVALRAHRRLRGQSSRLEQALVMALLCYLVAFAETYFMANELLESVFSYRDRRFALLVGSAGYGTLFLCTLPILARLDEDPGPPRPLRAVLWDLLGANGLALCAYELWAVVLGGG